MVYTSLNLPRSRPSLSLRATVVVVAFLVVIFGGGCRRQGGAGPQQYERERREAEEAVARESAERSFRVMNRYPWQERGEPGLEPLPQRISEIESAFRRENDIHRQVMYGRRTEDR